MLGIARLFMKTTDISKSPIVKRFGAHGARLYGKVWFFLLYLMLVALTAGFCSVGPELAAGWRRIFVGCFVGALVVFVASLLTRMRLKFFAEIAELETREKLA